MKVLKKTEQIFRDKLNQQTFHYKDSYWNEMESLLDDAMPVAAGKRRIIYRIAAAVVLLLGFSFSFWLFDTPPGSEIENMAVLKSYQKPAYATLMPETETTTKAQAAHYTANRNTNNTHQIINSPPEPTGDSEETHPSLTTFRETATPSPPAGSFSVELVENHLQPFDTYAAWANMEQVADAKSLTQAVAEEQNFATRGRFEIIGGTVISQGFTNKRLVAEGYSSDPLFGLGYRYQLNHNWQLHLNLQYSTRGSLASDSTYESTQYSFGYTQQRTKVSPLKLHYAEMPLFISYHVNRNHSFSMGVNPMYIVRKTNRVSSAVENSFGTDYNQNEAQGYLEGFRKTDIALLAGYSYRFSGGLNLSAMLNYGLTDVTHNDYFHNQSADKNLQLRLQISYEVL